MFNSLKLKYTVRNSKKTKQTKNKRTHEVQLHVRVYTYDFRRSVVTDN